MRSSWRSWRRSHRLADRVALGAGDLRVEQLAIHAARPTEHRWLAERLASAGLEPMRLTTVTLTEAIIGLAEAGEAVAILPRAAADAAIRAGRVHARCGSGRAFAADGSSSRSRQV